MICSQQAHVRDSVGALGQHTHSQSCWKCGLPSTYRCPSSLKDFPQLMDLPHLGSYSPFLHPSNPQLMSDCQRSTKVQMPFPKGGSPILIAWILGGLLPQPCLALPPPLLKALPQQFTCTGIPAPGSIPGKPTLKEF